MSLRYLDLTPEVFVTLCTLLEMASAPRQVEVTAHGLPPLTELCGVGTLGAGSGSHSIRLFVRSDQFPDGIEPLPCPVLRLIEET